MSEDVAVSVCVRVRPLNDLEPQAAWSVSTRALSAQTDRHASREWDFGDGRVFTPDATTERVYAEAARPIVLGALKGYHGYVFAYGQTSSGKTHTMLGTDRSPGIVPLAMADLFEQTAELQSCVIRVSYLEIYNEQVRDLLDPKKGLLDVYLDEKRIPMIFVGRLGRTESTKVEATVRVVTTVGEAMDVIRAGEANRHYGATKLNAGSSRSHTLFRVEISSRDPTRRSLRVSELFLVDLAGTECVKKSGVRGAGAEEAGRINRSLLALEKVVRCLDEASRGNAASLRNAALVTRESKLTRFLKPALGGNSRTAVICTVTPARQHVTETVATLDFAARAMNIRNKCRVNEVQQSQVQETQLVREYRTQMDDFRVQLLEAQQRLLSLQQERDELQRAAVVKTDSAAEAVRAGLESQLDQQRTLQRELELKIAAMEAIVQPEQAKRQHAEQACVSAMREVESLVREKQSHETTILQLQQLVRRLQMEAAEKVQEENSLRDRVDTLELSLDEATEALSAANARADELEAALRQKENELAAAHRKLSASAAKEAELRQQLDVYRADHERPRGHSGSDVQLQQANTEREEVEQRLHSAQKELQKVRVELQACAGERFVAGYGTAEALQRWLAQQRERMQQLEHEGKAAQQQVVALQQDRDKLAALVARQDGRGGDSDDVEAVRAERDSLQRQVAQLKKKSAMSVSSLRAMALQGGGRTGKHVMEELARIQAEKEAAANAG